MPTARKPFAIVEDAPGHRGDRGRMPVDLYGYRLCRGCSSSRRRRRGTSAGRRRGSRRLLAWDRRRLRALRRAGVEEDGRCAIAAGRCPELTTMPKRCADATCSTDRRRLDSLAASILLERRDASSKLASRVGVWSRRCSQGVDGGVDFESRLASARQDAASRARTQLQAIPLRGLSRLAISRRVGPTPRRLPGCGRLLGTAFRCGPK